MVKETFEVWREYCKLILLKKVPHTNFSEEDPFPNLRCCRWQYILIVHRPWELTESTTKECSKRIPSLFLPLWQMEDSLMRAACRVGVQYRNFEDSHLFLSHQHTSLSSQMEQQKNCLPLLCADLLLECQIFWEEWVKDMTNRKNNLRKGKRTSVVPDGEVRGRGLKYCTDRKEKACRGKANEGTRHGERSKEGSQGWDVYCN